MNVTTHLHLVPRLRMSAALPPCPHTPSWLAQRPLCTYLRLRVLATWKQLTESSCQHFSEFFLTKLFNTQKQTVINFMLKNYVRYWRHLGHPVEKVRSFLFITTVNYTQIGYVCNYWMKFFMRGVHNNCRHCEFHESRHSESHVEA
jgi:hypothetical protein